MTADLLTMSDEEFKSLENARTEDEWNAACDALKTARGGRYPHDFFPRVHLSGLMARKNALFESQRPAFLDRRNDL